jgi:hypothetical protein
MDVALDLKEQQTKCTIEFLRKCSENLEKFRLNKENLKEDIAKKRILRCLKLFKVVIDKSEHRGIGNLRSHSGLIKGEMVNVIVTNDIKS